MRIIMRLIRAVKRIRGPDCIMVMVTMTIIPVFYLAEVIGILPEVCERWGFWYTFHFIVSLFLLHNIIGNLGRGMGGPGNVYDDMDALTQPTADWRFCAECERVCPPRSWHCAVCEVCIFKRDHHCNFFGCCVGYFNYRYFFMFVAYVFVATLYALIVNGVYFVQHVNYPSFGLLSIFTFMFPFASLMVDWSYENGCIVLFVVNVVFLLFTFYLFVYHLRILIKGRTVGESKHLGPISYDHGWRKNFADAFGQNWHLVWLTPFIRSPLPGDGTHWKRALE